MVQNESSTPDVVLIVDAISLYKGTWWDPKEQCFVGRVDYGTGLPEAEDELATEALVFMLSSILGHWKHTIAYFLQNKIFYRSFDSTCPRFYWSFFMLNVLMSWH